MDFLDRSNEERINSEAEGEDRQKQALGVESHKGQEEIWKTKGSEVYVVFIISS